MTIALAAQVALGCASMHPATCPAVRDPLLTIKERIGYVEVSSDELLDWKTSYETLEPGVARNFYFKGPDGSQLHVFFGREGSPGGMREFEAEAERALRDRGDPIHARFTTATCLGGVEREGLGLIADYSTYRGRFPYRVEIYDAGARMRPVVIRVFAPPDDEGLWSELRMILSRTELR